jgi:hypothetical protein
MTGDRERNKMEDKEQEQHQEPEEAAQENDQGSLAERRCRGDRARG